MDTFQEALKSVDEQSRKSLLIGNGFSIGFDHERFGYRSLLQKADLPTQNSDIRQIFKEFDTSDFEVVIGSLDLVRSINNLFGCDLGELESEIGEDQQTIRDSFLQVLCELHPED